jgi:hypothetical protein
LSPFYFFRVLFVSGIFYNVPYKNSAAIASVDFPQENQTQQVHKVFRFETKIALFLYIVVECAARPSEPLLFAIRCVSFLKFLFSYLSKMAFSRSTFFLRLSEKVR